MWPMSTVAQQVIRTSHGVAIRGTAYSTVQGQYDGLPIAGGTVVDDSTAQTRRGATVNIADPTLWPDGLFDPLSPAGSELQLDYGITIPGQSTEWIPLIRGVISQSDEVIPFGPQGITITLLDRSQHIKDDVPQVPLQVGGTGTVVAAITSLITSTYPAAVILDQTGDTTICPLITIQQDKWSEGIEVLATSIGAECYVDPVGDFVIRYQPLLTDPHVWIVNTGPDGILVQNQRVRTRDSVYNSVTASGETSAGAGPSATVYNNDTTTATYWGGPFGRKPRKFVSPTLTSVAQCTAAAQAILARAIGMDTQMTVQVVPNPALQTGDVVRILGETGEKLGIIDAIQTPLDFSQTQQLVVRTIVLPAEQGAH